MITLSTDLVGKTIRKVVENTGDNNTYFIFKTDDGDFSLVHHQDCCENVYHDSTTGNLDDILNSPVLSVSDDCTCGDKDYGDFQDTFWTIETAKGIVTFSFHGESNGYYGIGVCLEKIGH